MLRLARCWNATEFTTKHMTLAEDCDTMFTAGEMSIVTDDNGVHSVEYNDMSGTYYKVRESGIEYLEPAERADYEAEMMAVMKACFRSDARVVKVDHAFPIGEGMSFGPVIQLIRRWVHDPAPRRGEGGVWNLDEAIADFDRVRIVTGDTQTYVTAYLTMKAIQAEPAWIDVVRPDLDVLRSIHMELLESSLDIASLVVPSSWHAAPSSKRLELRDFFKVEGAVVSGRVHWTDGSISNVRVTLGEFLGQGAFSMTFACEVENRGVRYGVVKVNFNEFLRHARRTGRSINFASHSQFGSDGGFHEQFLLASAMEYPMGVRLVPPGSMELDFMLMPRMSPVPANRRVDALWDVLEALDAMHQKKIMHMDVKMDNIMFYPDENKFVLIDCGLCTKSKSKDAGGTPYYSGSGVWNLVRQEAGLTPVKEMHGQLMHGQLIVVTEWNDWISWLLNVMEVELPGLWSMYTQTFVNTASYKLGWLRRMRETLVDTPLCHAAAMLLDGLLAGQIRPSGVAAAAASFKLGQPASSAGA